MGELPRISMLDGYVEIVEDIMNIDQPKKERE
jgi:hypothetical protein